MHAEGAGIHRYIGMSTLLGYWILLATFITALIAAPTPSKVKLHRKPQQVSLHLPLPSLQDEYPLEEDPDDFSELSTTECLEALAEEPDLAEMDMFGMLCGPQLQQAAPEVPYKVTLEHQETSVPVPSKPVLRPTSHEQQQADLQDYSKMKITSL